MMRVLPSITVDAAKLVSTTVAVEDPSPVWAAGSAWAKDSLCHRVETHRVYRRITAGTTPTAPESDGDNWQDLRPTNKWAMFDDLRSTRTRVEGGPLTVVINPGQRVDSVGLVGLVGKKATISSTKGGITVTREFSLVRRNVSNWYEYFTAPIEQRDAAVTWDLPPNWGATITVTIEPIGGVAECGRLSLGMGVVIGELLWNYDDDALNFSRIERDFAGSLMALVRRRSVPSSTLPVRVDAARFMRVRALREELNAVPALWVGWTRHPDAPYAQGAIYYGIYRRFSLKPENKLYAMAQLELEET